MRTAPDAAAISAPDSVRWASVHRPRVWLLLGLGAVITAGLVASVGRAPRPQRLTPATASQAFGMDVTPPGVCAVRGKVRYGTAPVTAGRLLFWYDTGPVPVPAEIKSDGTYLARQLAPGKARVAVLLDPKGDLPLPRGSVGPSVRAALSGDGPAATPKGPPPPQGNRRARPQIPSSFIRQLTDFVVPVQATGLHKQLHRKYAAPFGPDTPQVEVKPGVTEFDIVLR
ncbi:hypothetical protein [Gemmata sp.]|uniref:hypothetical protein n=1 Tax=Gemmata sp. TaxID=1914242 RepID=UPI003F7115D0